MNRHSKEDFVARAPRPRAKLADSLHQQLNMYALAAGAAGVGALALAQTAEAKIVYTPAHRVIRLNQSYHLDLNHDGVTDFTLANKSFHNQSLSISFQMVYHSAPTGNGVVGHAGIGGGPYDSVIERGGRIGGNRRFLASRGLLLTKTSRGFTYGHWYDARNRYLGLKFKIGSETHYGWARLSVVGKYRTITATLTGYAYETIPGKPIIAGATTGPDDDAQAASASTNTHTPEPATLGMLALGAPGPSIWRRKEPVAATSDRN
jgi:hypothetical protein